MQTWYNEAVAKSNDGSDQLIGGATEEAKSSATSATSSAQQNEEAKKQSQKAYGEDGYRYPSLDFPASQESLTAYHASVVDRIEAKYETLIKNVHFYLAYLCLETADY